MAATLDPGTLHVVNQLLDERINRYGAMKLNADLLLRDIKWELNHTHTEQTSKENHDKHPTRP